VCPNYTQKNYLANDWTVALDLLLDEKFKTLEKSYIILGVKGFLRSKSFLDYTNYNSKKIYALLPMYELTKDFFKKTIFRKELNTMDKIYLYFLCIKGNLSFF
jgi:hypothetical protein